MFFTYQNILLFNQITNYFSFKIKLIDLYILKLFSSANTKLLEEDTEIQSWVQELVKERNNSSGGVGILVGFDFCLSFDI